MMRKWIGGAACMLLGVLFMGWASANQFWLRSTSVAPQPGLVQTAVDTVSVLPIRDRVVQAVVLEGLDGAPPARATQSLIQSESGEKRSVVGALLRISRVNVKGNNRLSSEEIRKEGGVNADPFIWDVSLVEIERNLRKNPWVKDVTVSRSILGKEIDIDVEEVQPLAVVEFRGSSWLVDRYGKMISPLSRITDRDMVVEMSELPRIDGVDEVAGGAGRASKSVDARVHDALTQLLQLESAGGMPFPVLRYTLLTDGGLLVVPTEPIGIAGVKIGAADTAEAKTKLSQLAQLMRALPPNQTQSQVVDLRFNNQAIVY